MGFEGLALTDCMEMDAIKRCFGIGKGAVMAVEAGCDILCFSHTLKAVEEAFKGVYDAVKSGRLSEALLDKAIARIKTIKAKYGLVGRPIIEKNKAVSLCEDRNVQAFNENIAAASITLLSSSQRGPDVIKLDKKVFLSPESLALTGAEDNKHERLCFSAKCAQRFGGRSIITPLNDVNEEAEVVLNSDFDVAVLGLYNARFRPGQVKLLRQLEASGKPLIVVLLGGPYDKALVERADAIIAAYEYTPLSVKAVIDALEKGVYPGKSPVYLP